MSVSPVLGRQMKEGHWVIWPACLTASSRFSEGHTQTQLLSEKTVEVCTHTHTHRGTEVGEQEEEKKGEQESPQAQDCCAGHGCFSPRFTVPGLASPGRLGFC